MESSVRILEYQLSRGSKMLVGTNGDLSPLISASPLGHRLPRGCVEEWRSRADQDGYLDWEGFSTGLANALQADASRLRNMADSATSSAERMSNHHHHHNPSLQASQGRGLGAWLLTKPVEGREIEGFLSSSCDGGMLVQALVRTKKEVYRCQRSLQQLEEEAAKEDKESANRESERFYSGTSK